MDGSIFQQVLYYVNGVWRRRWWVVLVAWFVCVAGWSYVATLPDVYKSSARIYVDTSNILRPLLRGIAVDDNIESEISFIQRTLTSRPNLTKIAGMTDLDISAVTPSETQELLNRIQKNTEISKQGENLFHISFTAPDPAQAKNVVQSYLTLFVESNLGQSRQDRDSARDFLDEQIRDYERQLTESETRLAKFKQENAGLLPGERGFETTLNRALDGLAAADSEYRAVIEKRDVLKRQLNEIPATIQVQTGDAVTGGPPSQSVIRILELEDQVEALLQQFTEEHPDVKAVKRRLEAVRAEHEAELKALDEGSGGPGGNVGFSGYTIPNNVHERVKLDLIATETIIPVLKDKIERLKESVEQQERLAAQVPEVEAAFTRLNRDYTVIKRNHDVLLERRESARLSRARELKAEEVQFRVVEPPVLPNLPVGPQRGVFIVVTTIVGIGAGLGVAGLLFVISGAISSVVGLKNQFKVPVLGVVSVVESASTKKIRGLRVFACFATLMLLLGTCGGLLLIEQRVGLANIVPDSIIGGTKFL